MSPEENRFIEGLFEQRSAQLRRYANTCVGNESVADELVADVFHVAMEKVETLMNHENPSGWLKQVMKNKVKQRWRAQQRDARRFLELDEEAVACSWSARPTEEAVERELSDQADIKGKVKAALNEAQYYVLRRVALENATHKAVAGELGISVWNSQKILERARKALDKRFPGRAKRKKKK